MTVTDLMTDTSRRHGGLAEMTRTVCSVAAGVVFSVERAVVGDARVRTASGNAWEAVLADRARARQRDEMRLVVEALAQRR